MKKIFFTLFITVFLIMSLSFCVFAEDTVFDITDYCDARPTAKEGEYGDATGKDLVFRDWYLIIQDFIEAKLDSDFCYTYNGMKYSFSQLKTAETRAIYVEMAETKTIAVEENYYSKIGFFAGRRTDNTPDGTFPVTLNYEDGTSETKTVEIGKHYGETRPFANPFGVLYVKLAGTAAQTIQSETRIYNYEIEVQSDKTLKSVTFGGNSADVSAYIYAFSALVELDYPKIINKKINNLPESITEDNMAAVEKELSKISVLLGEFTEAGGNINLITNISKYNSLKAQFPIVESVSFKNDKQFLTVEATFNSEVSEETVNGYITLNDEKTEATEKTFSVESGKTKVQLKFKHYRNYDKTHNFVIEKGAKGIASGLGMIESFKTEASLSAPFNVSDFKVIKTTDSSLIESLGGLGSTEIKVSANLNNTAVSEGQSYIVVMGLYGNDNELIDCEIKVGSLAIGSEPKNESWTFTLPSDVTENYNISYFVIDTEGKTLYNPISLK